ncbi:RraA family protein [Oscillospiraceae bacterium LTW-04]|nr:hypothetical protein RBH76_04655 [Oscillospiraceae bacterium MB24-C1]
MAFHPMPALLPEEIIVRASKLSTAQLADGMKGLGIPNDGCIALGMPVYARGFMQRGPGKKGPGEINQPVTCGGITVSPGDLIVGDYDGVTAVPRDRILEVLEKAEEKAAYEEKRDAAIAAYKAAVALGQEPPQLAPQWVLDMHK